MRARVCSKCPIQRGDYAILVFLHRKNMGRIVVRSGALHSDVGRVRQKTKESQQARPRASGKEAENGQKETTPK
jgi:hypothetical protein